MQAFHLKRLLYSLIAVSLVACSDSGNDNQTNSQFLAKSESASVADCPAGGTTVTFGYDTNEDGSIDEVIDTTTICSSEPNPELLIEQSHADACEFGGTTLTFGYDTTEDGTIDSIAQTVEVCSMPYVLEAIEGSRVLYFDDAPSYDGDHFALALSNLGERGIIELTEATSDNFLTELDTENYDVVFYSQRVSSSDSELVTELTNWIDSGKAAVFLSWQSTSDLYPVFEASTLGNNQIEAILRDPIIGVGLNRIALTNVNAWGTFSQELEPTGTAYSACSFENDTSCAVVGNSGRTVVLGFLTDSLSLEDAEILVPNIIRQVTF